MTTRTLQRIQSALRRARACWRVWAGARSRRAWLVAAAIVVVIATITFASIPGSNGVITGCYVTRTGLLRVIDTAQTTTCNPNEGNNILT